MLLAAKLSSDAQKKRGGKNGMFFNGSRTQIQVKTTYIKGKHFHANLHASGNRFDWCARPIHSLLTIDAIKYFWRLSIPVGANVGAHFPSKCIAHVQNGKRDTFVISSSCPPFLFLSIFLFTHPNISSLGMVVKLTRCIQTETLVVDEWANERVRTNEIQSRGVILVYVHPL